METPGRIGAISRLLRRQAEGDREAMAELVSLLYERLRRIARGQIARNRRFDTLNTTALVHEAYLRMEREKAVDWRDRDHFFAICARTMRRVIVDHARRQTAEKRGGGRAELTLQPEHAELFAEAESWLAVDRALETLAEFNERLTRTVECRVFAGLSEEETASALGVSRRTVQRDWVRARAWLRRELG